LNYIKKRGDYTDMKNEGGLADTKSSAGSKNKAIYIGAAIVLIVVIICAAYILTRSSNGPVVANGDKVAVYYTGRFTNGTVFGSNFGNQTLNFTVGAGQTIEGFNQAVIGMKLNQTKNVTIPENEAYGPVNQTLIIKVPANEFADQNFTIGQGVTETSQSGQQATGTIIAFNSTTVTINFNPRLAGQTLLFTIKVVGIQSNSTS
jgi:peptidylprolyl isomerase